ncbi:hypothetical protein [Roseovarius arcticus]|uniref:hypothetical protein n=1 Tax=Roseovarius arcticus TaxID=2547404 RepID=UPI0011107041|nr:hypothetical protein [Roseovarius arcticus]
MKDVSIGRAWRAGPILLLIAAVMICLSVLAINRGPLYYFDTGSYFKQGNAALALILPERRQEKDPATAGQSGQKKAKAEDETTDGSRSMVYALLVAAFWRIGALGGIALVNMTAVFASVWLAARVACRTVPLGRSSLQLTAIPLLAAGATSLPFYIAYVMPDIFAPVMIILLAAVVAMGREMRLSERLAAFALAAFAVVLHPSHLGIAVLMLPVIILAALLRVGHGRWLAVGFAASLVVVAIAERKAYEFAAETVTSKDVIYTPYITARLIVDGPGLAYLDENCARADLRQDLATCALHEALSWSDDPYRLTATHIVFERSARLGSFLLMPIEDQKAVAAEQREFFLRVLADNPFGIVYALMENAGVQLMMNSVGMTIPNTSVILNTKAMSGLPEAQLDVLNGVLNRDQRWLGLADKVHSVIYILSFLIVVGLLIWPGRIPPPLNVFVLFLLIGVVLNALVCGGVSQPADRYGARVMWLLPFLATFLLLCLPRRKSQAITGAPS